MLGAISCDRRTPGPTLNLTQQFVLDQITNIASIGNSNGERLSVLASSGIDQDLAAADGNGLIQYALKDGVNSTVGTADQAGVSKETLAYEPFR